MHITGMLGNIGEPSRSGKKYHKIEDARMLWLFFRIYSNP